MTVDLNASTTWLRFWQTDPAAAVMRGTVLGPDGGGNFGNVAFCGGSRGRGHCQGGSAGRPFSFKPSVNDDTFTICANTDFHLQYSSEAVFE